MPRNLLLSGVVLALVVAAPGCAYKVFVRGVLPEENSPSLQPGASIYVRENVRSEHVATNRQIAGKLEKLLAERGYPMASEEEAELFLFFDYEEEALLQKRVLEPISGPPTGIMTVRREGPFVYTLTLSLVDAESFRDEAREAPEIVWAGGAMLDTISIYSPQIVDLLLVAAFEHFGDDTGPTRSLSLTMNDRRARALRGR